MRQSWRGYWVLGVVFLAAAAACRKNADPQTASSNDRPNVLLITVESLRADHVGCYGYERPTTPNIDALSAQATRYTQAYSATSWTLTSHASMFTGLYPKVHQVTLPQDRLSDAHTTAAEVLADDGYQCAAVVGGPYLRKTFNLSQGFEYFDESVASSSNDEAHRDVTNPRMAEAMERFLREGRDPRRPFFMFGYYWDVHYDFIPPAPYDTMFVPDGAEPIDAVQFGPIVALGRDISEAQLAYLTAQYDGEIRCTDEYLGRLWALLRELDLWDNTVIILTADHGEQFFEHSYLGHKHDLYVESLHVPLLIKRAGQTQGRRDDRVVNLIDLFPTILDLTDGSTTVPINGRSLEQSPAANSPPTFFDLTTTWDIAERGTDKSWRESERWVAVREGRYKLLHVQDTEFWQLYDVVSDPQERHPLGAEYEKQGSELVQRLDSWEKAMNDLSTLWQAGPRAQLSPEEERRLRSLGYIP
ncbi:MAG: sulfatase-like hydrolase/transferase [bacterium]|nr:sulfatase-like hydrolase/transferase [bacterium]